MKHQLFAYTGKFVPQYDIGAQNATKSSEYERFTNFGGGACTLQVAKTYYLLTEDSRDIEFTNLQVCSRVRAFGLWRLSQTTQAKITNGITNVQRIACRR